MPDLSKPADDEPGPLTAIVARFYADEDAGRTPDRAALLAAHPDHAAALREFFAGHDRAKRAAGPPPRPEDESTGPAADLGELGTVGTPDDVRDAARSASAGGHTRPGEGAGAVIAGRYKLLDQIGEGGMGAVWMAEQRAPVKRTVALKLIKPGMASAEILARFDAERQALALMDHPNIARVYDGGISEAGAPFFVMELVKGTPITKFCDERRLTPRQRLELFVPVCQAIQHAHQKGVIHRDIKPGNVLVGLYDDRPVPKVIDFGIAKATGQTLTDLTLHTGFDRVVGTPAYMSPEQATLNNLDIDTRSDVYSLGVLLYELLAGTPPFSKDELQQYGLLEILRIVREQEPPRPSAKLSSSQTKASISATRGTEPKKLTQLLRGEIDWIVMKALEKSRVRRYDTANGFAADLQRYLAGERVEAVPPSLAYRARKFIGKNRGPVTAATLLVIALTAGMAASSIGFARANKAKEGEVTQRHIAEQREQDAKAAEDLAQQRADDVTKERDAKDKQLTRAEKLVYASNIANAQRAWDIGRSDIAWHFLETVRKVMPQFHGI